MGTDDQIHTATGGKTVFSFARRGKSRPAAFVIQWRAVQRELTFKTTQLERFSAGISGIVTVRRRASGKTLAAASLIAKSRLGNSIAS